MARTVHPPLTPSIVKRPSASGKAELVYDGATPGLCIRKRKTNVYYYVYKIGRTKRWLMIGDVVDLSLDEARKAAIVARGIVRDGGDPAAAKKAAKAEAVAAVVAAREPSDKSLRAMLADYKSVRLPRLKTRSQAEYKRILDTRIPASLLSKPADAITLRDVELLHAGLGDKKVEANRVVAVLSAAMTWGRRHGWTSINPCLDVEKHPEHGRRVFLDEKQMFAAVAALDAEPAERRYESACIRFLLLTGARLSEARRLLWSGIDTARGVAVLVVHKTDGTIGPKDITLPPSLIDMLAQLAKSRRPGSDIVFDPGGVRKGGADKDGFIPERRIERAWARVRTAARLPPCRIHDLRHSFATLAISKGVNIAVVSQMLGHANIHTTMEYVEALDEARGAAASVIDLAVGNV